MTSVDDRLTRLEEEMDQFRPSLYRRLEKLEQEVIATDAMQPVVSSAGGYIDSVRTGAKQFIGWMGAELPKLFTALVIVLVGWGIKDSVDLSIKQRQLDLSYATEMQALLAKMGEKNAEMVQLQSTAVVLASYGAPALPSLLRELSQGGLRAEAAITGIRSLALTQPVPVCEALPRVLSNRAKQFDWLAQQNVVAVLGENDCINAIVPLTNYRATVAEAQAGNTAAFKQIVRALPLSPEEDYPSLLAAVERSLKMIDSGENR